MDTQAGDPCVAELIPTEFCGTGVGISVGGGRLLSISAPALVGLGIAEYGPTGPYLAFVGLWTLTIIGYVMGRRRCAESLRTSPAGEVICGGGYIGVAVDDPRRTDGSPWCRRVVAVVWVVRRRWLSAPGRARGWSSPRCTGRSTPCLPSS